MPPRQCGLNSNAHGETQILNYACRICKATDFQTPERG
jgi:hypothetical protein